MPDFTKLPWQLNIAVIGAVFAIFALIHDTYYINYGFLTLLYGVVAHLAARFCEHLFSDRKMLYLFFGSQAICLVAWVVAVLWVY